MYEIQAEHGTDRSGFAHILDERMGRIAAVLSRHKDLFEESVHAEHVKFVCDLRPRLERSAT